MDDPISTVLRIEVQKQPGMAALKNGCSGNTEITRKILTVESTLIGQLLHYSMQLTQK